MRPEYKKSWCLSPFWNKYWRIRKWKNVTIAAAKGSSVYDESSPHEINLGIFMMFYVFTIIYLANYQNENYLIKLILFLNYNMCVSLNWIVKGN